MKTKLPQILTTTFQNAKQEFQANPIRTLIAIIGLISLSGFGILFHSPISALLEKTVELNILLLTLASLLLVTSLLLIIWEQCMNKNSEVKTDLIEAEGFKWETTFQNKSVLHVSHIPFCATHELRLTEYMTKYRCNEEDCTTSIQIRNLPSIYEIAIAHIERYIRQKC